jgi:hypothetical protein
VNVDTKKAAKKPVGLTPTGFRGRLKNVRSESDLASCAGNQLLFGDAGCHLDQFQSVLGHIQHAQVSDDAIDDTNAREWQVAVLE